jgi:thiol-disulfide isomerase/thioredoxin
MRRIVSLSGLVLMIVLSACGGGGGSASGGGGGGGTAALSAPGAAPSQGTYAGIQFVTLSTATPGASIRFTIDGSTPTSTTGTLYTGPIRVDRPMTIRAIVCKSGCADSPVFGGSYTITGTRGPAAVGSYDAMSSDGPVESVDGKPVIRLFGTTWCPHSAYLGDMFDRVAREYVAAGKVVAFHWQLDTGDDVMTAPVETAVPDSEWAVFDAFSLTGSVPAIVVGGKYYRVGSAYESFGNGLALEEQDLRAAIEEVIREAAIGSPVPGDNTAMTYDEALGTILRGALIDNLAASALSVPAGYFRVQEFRNFTDTSKACITLGISRNYYEAVWGNAFPQNRDEWVFSIWDSSSYNSTGRTARVRDLHGHTLTFDIRFGQPLNTVVSATLDGVPIGLSTQSYTTGALNSAGWLSEPPWTVPGG